MQLDDHSTAYEPVGIEAVGPAPAASLDPDRTLGWFRRVWPLLLARRFRFVVGLTSALVAMVVGTLLPRVVMGAIDRALVARAEPLARFVTIFLVLAVIRAVLTHVYRRTLFGLAYDLEYDLRVTMHAHLLRLGNPYFDRVQAGQLISRANSDIRSVQMFLTFAPLLILNLASFAVGIGLMLAINVKLTITALVTLPITFLAGRRLRNLTFPLSWIIMGRSAEVATVVDENVQGVRVVKSFAAEQREVYNLARVAKRLQWAQIQAIDARAWWGPVVENLPRLGLAFVLLVGGLQALDGHLTVGGLVAFQSYVLLIQTPFRLLPMVLIMGQRAAASAGRIFEVLDEKPTIVDAAGAIDLVTSDGTVVFDHVSFRYAGDGGTPLADFTMRIAPGETVAIVGRTGSGKSSVARLMARFYDVTDGSVRIDGHDVRELTLASLRHHVGVVTDEPFLFSDSIRSNIAFARPGASDAEVRAAAAAAQATEFIEQLSNGFDTVVGERGYDLSGGQRQRIALARALLANPTVLVLDDATSAIDAHIETLIHDAVRAIRADRTTVVIAHRLSSIALADRVVLLEDGVVAAQGTHSALLANEPRYAAVLTLDGEGGR